MYLGNQFSYSFRTDLDPELVWGWWHLNYFLACPFKGHTLQHITRDHTKMKSKHFRAWQSAINRVSSANSSACVAFCRKSRVRKPALLGGLKFSSVSSALPVKKSLGVELAVSQMNFSVMVTQRKPLQHFRLEM